MMYQDKLAVAIKHNGKILRENKDLVQLPFGSEFSVLIKNLNSRRVKFTLHIDGTDVLDGESIVVNANSEIEMKRFIRNGNMNEGNAFKFTERTQSIEDGPRGINVDDGIVRVEFHFEQAAPVITTTVHNDIWWNDYYRRSIWHSHSIGGPYYGIGNSSSPLRGMTGNVASTDYAAKAAGSLTNASSGNIAHATVSQNSAQPINTVFTNSVATEINDAGITVPGSKVDQKFQAVYGFNAENQSHVIVLRLAGSRGATTIVVPVTVKTKNVCTTCSHTNKHNAKFCSECGTSLVLV